MNYTRPEVAVLGAAAEVILQPLKNTTGLDSGRNIAPAYDLDE